MLALILALWNLSLPPAEPYEPRRDEFAAVACPSADDYFGPEYGDDPADPEPPRHMLVEHDKWRERRMRRQWEWEERHPEDRLTIPAGD